MRIWISGIKTYVNPVLPGDTMTGSIIGEVIYSNSKKFSKGDIVETYSTW